MPFHTTATGIRTWFDDSGSGDPLLLLHGGFGHSGDFDDRLERLTGRFRVLRQDRRGHGRSPDAGGEMTFEQVADDTIDLLENVVDSPTDLVGYSDGGTVALQVAVRRPDLVRRLVCISGVFHHTGPVPGVIDDGPETIASLVDTPMAADHAALSPDGPDHFPVVARKVMAMSVHGPVLTPADLARIEARTLVMSGDDDMVTLEHTTALYRGVRDAEMAVVPGTSHALAWEKPDLCWSLVWDFLTVDPVPTMIPRRRAGSQPDVGETSG